jgi:phosphate transport system substrate-binding protein
LISNFRKSAMVLAIVCLVFVLAACGNNNSVNSSDTNSTSGSGATNSTPTPVKEEPKQEEPAVKLSGEITIDGSSTVYPISQAVAEEFMALHPDVNITVNVSGSGNGAKRMIAGEIDIADMSRKFKEQELTDAAAGGNEVVLMEVAYDGITVVINKDNDWAKEMTAAELKQVWEKDSKVTKWSDIRAEWPNEKINLFGPGTASGTFEYFTEAINGEAKVSRDDFTPSEDDNVLVTGVSGDKYAMGYFGYSYFIENTDKLQAVAIQAEGATTFVEPIMETINDGSYAPLSRPIFIYPSKKAMERPEVQEFIKFYMSTEGQDLAAEVGYVKLPQSKYDENVNMLP